MSTHATGARSVRDLSRLNVGECGAPRIATAEAPVLSVQTSRQPSAGTPLPRTRRRAARPAPSWQRRHLHCAAPCPPCRILEEELLLGAGHEVHTRQRTRHHRRRLVARAWRRREDRAVRIRMPNPRREREFASERGRPTPRCARQAARRRNASAPIGGHPRRRNASSAVKGDIQGRAVTNAASICESIGPGRRTFLGRSGCQGQTSKKGPGGIAGRMAAGYPQFVLTRVCSPQIKAQVGPSEMT